VENLTKQTRRAERKGSQSTRTVTGATKALKTSLVQRLLSPLSDILHTGLKLSPSISVCVRERGRGGERKTERDCEGERQREGEGEGERERYLRCIAECM
jgi:hypothetical protein